MANDENKIILEFPATNIEIEFGETITFDNISGFLNSDRVTYNGESLTEKIAHLENDKADKDTTYTKNEVDTALDGKLNKVSPTSTGRFFSFNRKENSAFGSYSVAMGRDVVASAGNSFAEGEVTTASGISSHAEGGRTIASGNCSHAEGQRTVASGNNSHAEGYQTEAKGGSQHVSGKYNIVDDNNEYAEIIGNGTGYGENARSNARTLDWQGNEMLAGDLTFNGNKSLTSEISRLDNRITDLPEPMVFKGTLGVGGTIETLPTASASNEGWMFKCITAGTYAGLTLKVGDTVTCFNPPNTSTYYWDKTGSQDTDTDTWRNIKVNGVEKLGNGISSGAVDFEDTANVKFEFDADGNKISATLEGIYTESEVDDLLDDKADADNTYTKEQVDDIVYNILPDDTASGSVANFNTSLELPIKSLEVDVNAVQDLHGQDYPFPAGGGKNLFPPKEVSVSGITITLRSDGGIQINGTTASAFNATVTAPLKVGSYTLSCRFNGTTPSEGAARCQIYHQGTGLNVSIPNQDNTNTNKQFTVEEDLTGVEYRIRISANFNYQNVIYYPQLEKGSTMTNFVPYAVENICPISGWSAISRVHCGKNLWDEQWELGYISNTTGENSPTTTQYRTVGYIRIPQGVNLYLFNGNSDTLGLRFYDINKNFMGSRANLSSKVLVYGSNDLPVNVAFIRFVNTSTNAYLNNISFNYPSSDTTYHAYNPNGNTEVINLGGTYYGGHFTQDKAGHRRLVVTHKRLELSTLTDWSRITNYTNPFFRATLPEDCKVRTASNNPQIAICDSYAWYSSNQNYWQYIGNGEFVTAGFGVSSVNRVYIRNDDYTDKNTFVSSLSGVYIVYELATPIIIDLPDGEPITTLIGTNNIYADTGDTKVVFKSSVNDYVSAHSGGNLLGMGGVYLGGAKSGGSEEETDEGEDTEKTKEIDEPKEEIKTIGDMKKLGGE